MLRITIPAEEFWDEVNEEFIYTKEQTLQLEHSLVSLSKMGTKWCKAFLGKQDKNRRRNSGLCQMHDAYPECESRGIQKAHCRKLRRD